MVNLTLKAGFAKRGSCSPFPSHVLFVHVPVSFLSLFAWHLKLSELMLCLTLNMPLKCKIIENVNEDTN